ncbi:hypothetical protein E4U37_007704 [Claviceps purpurea]|nr:hypothetical protein E4U37_007704 [Claviceps purpurea]
MIGRLTFHHLVSLGCNFLAVVCDLIHTLNSLSLSLSHTHTRTHTHTDTSLYIPFKYFTSSNYSSRDQEK